MGLLSLIQAINLRLVMSIMPGHARPHGYQLDLPFQHPPGSLNAVTVYTKEIMHSYQCAGGQQDQ